MIQIFAAIVMLFAGTAVFAGTDRHHKPTDPSPEFTSTVRTTYKPVKKVGGETILVVWTFDINMKPVAGAKVDAPCTGQAPKYTDAKGQATFQLGNVCPCNEDALTVTTQKGCYQQIKVSCGTYQVQCNQ